MRNCLFFYCSPRDGAVLKMPSRQQLVNVALLKPRQVPWYAITVF